MTLKAGHRVRGRSPFLWQRPTSHTDHNSHSTCRTPSAAGRGHSISSKSSVQASISVLLLSSGVDKSTGTVDRGGWRGGGVEGWRGQDNGAIVFTETKSSQLWRPARRSLE